MPASWVIRVETKSIRDKRKYLYSKPMSWTKARGVLKLYRGRGHVANVVELTPDIEVEIARQTL